MDLLGGQKRLSYRYRHTTQAGKEKTVTLTVITRKLAGFLWDIDCHNSGRTMKLPVP